VFPIRDVNPTRITPWVTLLLIVGNVAIFFLVQATDSPEEQAEFLYRRAAIACEVTTGSPLSRSEIIGQQCDTGPAEPVFPDKSPFVAVFTSMFLHGSIAHVLFNMWFLWIFGNNVEEAFGRRGYLLLYLLGGVAATATFVVLNPRSTIPLVGASGAIAAALGAYGVLFPGHRILSLVGWFVIPVPAFLFLLVWFAAQFGLGGTGVAWEAHVGGFAFGVVTSLLFRARLMRDTAVR
jgi:membrane associated rhomboid family serine protease